MRRDEFLTYSVVGNTNTGLVSTTVENNRLSLNYANNQVGSATLTVRATDRYGVSVDSSFTVTVSNPPTATVTLDASSYATNATATATVARADLDGDLVNLTYVWKVNGTVVQTTSNTTSTTDTLDLSDENQGNKGQTITVEVTPSDSRLTGATVSDTATVVNSAPTIQTVAFSTDFPTTVTTLTATVIASDLDGDSLTYDYTWTHGATTLKSATAATSPTDFLDLTPFGLSVGDEVTLTVIAKDGTANSASKIASVFIV